MAGWVAGWMGLTLIIRLSLSSNWTELDWTGTELGNILAGLSLGPLACMSIGHFVSN